MSKNTVFGEQLYFIHESSLSFSASRVFNENLRRICLKAKTILLNLCYISHANSLYREMDMNNYPVLLFANIILLLTACQSTPACPRLTGTPQYLSISELEKLPSAPALSSGPIEVEINGKMITVDKVATGPLCNDYWKGIIYVACDVQVLKWEDTPLFLKNCDLSIESGTVVYVAYHNDAAYYNGCSCHTGVNPEH
jgi:hypothetical protein